nr:MAG TPA: hypothetical protein [Caudoviricetes sp.]
MSYADFSTYGECCFSFIELPIVLPASYSLKNFCA